MRRCLILMVVVVMIGTMFSMMGCMAIRDGLADMGLQYVAEYDNGWKNRFDTSLPDMSDAGADKDSANADGWYATLYEDFDDGLGEYFSPLRPGLRGTEYWCPSMVSVENGIVKVRAENIENHECEYNCGGKTGQFTGGIVTGKPAKDGSIIADFEQAYGYFEARVKFPDSDGMWSAFWLNAESMKQVGNKGLDGTEIDIFESSFYNKRTKVGHCVHYDAYWNDHRGCKTTRDVGKDLYDGFHTFAIKWTPNEYVFYVDGVATWATNFGGICQVPEYIFLTCEIREPGFIGPYGMRLGEFTGGTYEIDYVHVYQNAHYLEHIKSLMDFN